jgi:4-hydroxybenzoate polyprenyltransferase/phosphoserine phosphatase
MTLVSIPIAEESRPVIRPDLAPLAVDIDGTLLRGDLLAELALAYLRGNPFRILALVGWLARGKAVLKRKLAERVDIDPASLPVNDELVALIETERAAGREIHLATASDALVVAKLAKRFGFVDGVIASDGVTNLKGEAKARVLKERFPNGFAYAGDAAADLAVWRAAKETVVVEARPKTLKAAKAIRPPLAVIPRKPAGWKTYAKALRLHQWAKNALVVVPLVLGGRAFEPEAWLTALIGMALLGVLASSTYLLNDLWDLDDDRKHWSKRNRPFASGRLPIAFGLAAAPTGIVFALAGAAMINAATFLAFAAYLGLTLAYSLRLKRIMVLDAFTLASLFTLRLIVGIAVAGVPASPWLLVFSMFLFTSLSLAKRHTEILRVVESGAAHASGRGYIASDGPVLIALGAASGCSAVLVMVLYLIDEAFRAGYYSTPAALWAFPCALFLFLGRIWVYSGRGHLNDDPVVFAVKDKASLMLGAAMAAAFVVAVWPAALTFW